MPSSSSNEEIVRPLRELLRVRPSDSENEPEIILTIAPHVWSDPEVVRDFIIIDLHDLLGLADSWPLMGPPVSESILEDEVCRALLVVGWSQEQIQQQFRLDAKQAFRIDVALCHENGDLVAAIEVVSTHAFRRPSDLEARIEQVLANTQVQWVCVTDSREYRLFGRDGQRSTSRHPPSPHELGAGTSTPRQVPDAVRSVMRPADCHSLTAFVEEHAPKSVIVDFSLPWGHRTSASSPVRALLPTPVADQVPGVLESNQILLAWAASLESVRWISAVTQPSTVWANGTQWLRDWLTSRLGLAAHIELPPSIFTPITNIAGSFVLLGGHGDKTYFDSVTNAGDLVGMSDSNWFAGFVAWLRGEPASPGYEKPTASLDSWSVRANDPQAEQTRERLANLADTVPLGDVCDVFMGMNVSRDDTTTEPEGDATLIVSGRQLRTATDDDVEVRYLPESHEIRERDRLQAGDILLPRVFTPTATAVVYPENKPAVAGTSVIVIRSTADTLSPDYLAEFLNSSAGVRLIRSISSGTAVPQVSIASLRELPVPQIDIDLRALSEIDGIRSQLFTRADELESKRLQLFDSKNKDELRTKLTELQWRGDLITKTLRLTESLDFQISQLFPFPLAYSYRLLASYVEPLRRYQEQLRVAENVLAFLGSTALALLDQNDRSSLRDDIKDYWRRGISPGDWREITVRCSGLLRRYEGNPLASHFSRLNAGSGKKGIGKELQFLVMAKNDFKHDRGPKVEQDVLHYSRELQGSLERCMELLAFWTRHPIRQVQGLEQPRREARINLQCLRIVGDHPGFQQEEIKWHNALTKRDLYVEITDRFWVELFPFVQMLTCPRCKADEIYFIDKWDTKRGVATMKSFERGHTEENSETAAHLEAS